ncbi:hypothetical protein E2C01_070976 [Portunus trituberculatus]|uniref:Uncharacterized protein n=1 Tax=Portunus trituberculatus TaxID=210409 RepID=A0A5B7HVN8_PORTR|nr:hypothetical protein [Portunus trituberculatus]
MYSCGHPAAPQCSATHELQDPASEIEQKYGSSSTCHACGGGANSPSAATGDRCLSEALVPGEERTRFLVSRKQFDAPTRHNTTLPPPPPLLPSLSIKNVLEIVVANVDQK